MPDTPDNREVNPGQRAETPKLRLRKEIEWGGILAELTRNELLVWVNLMSHADKHTVIAYPSVETIASETGMHPDNPGRVRAALAGLIHKGFAELVRAGGGRGRSSHYRMTKPGTSCSLYQHPETGNNSESETGNILPGNREHPAAKQGTSCSPEQDVTRNEPVFATAGAAVAADAAAQDVIEQVKHALGAVGIRPQARDRAARRIIEHAGDGWAHVIEAMQLECSRASNPPGLMLTLIDGDEFPPAARMLAGGMCNWRGALHSIRTDAAACAAPDRQWPQSRRYASYGRAKLAAVDARAEAAAAEAVARFSARHSAPGRR